MRTSLHPVRTSLTNSPNVPALVRFSRAFGSSPWRSPPEMTGAARSLAKLMTFRFSLHGRSPFSSRGVNPAPELAHELVSGLLVRVLADAFLIPKRVIQNHQC